MGSFLDDDQSSTTSTPEDKYLKFADPEQGKAVEVKIRVLDQKPEKVFRHWIGPDAKSQRPYNCPSRGAGCPACAERQAVKEAGLDARDKHRMDKRYLVNALVVAPDGPKVKIFSFGQKLGEKLDFLHDRYGDLRDYDLTIIKRKTGPTRMNVEYDAIFEEKRDLTDEEKSASEGRYDLREEVKPSALEDIAGAIRGDAKTQARSEFATSDQIMVLTDLAKRKRYTLADLDILDTSKLTYERAEKLIQELQ